MTVNLAKTFGFSFLRSCNSEKACAMVTKGYPLFQKINQFAR
ncbi:hypothetical protein HMPREF1557_02116 [Streptococcus sobrinus W1703]|uniref:Uncharacterized protein n=1 Tax=Streptococcus sobrinus W1703 TaxID=1227275 RepID=U2K9H9_9STRE|nr:hypothetical protein HMPREF1557_02116 [Streptococcus sobrinus W1703]